MDFNYVSPILATIFILIVTIGTFSNRARFLNDTSSRSKLLSLRYFVFMFFSIFSLSALIYMEIFQYAHSKNSIGGLYLKYVFPIFLIWAVIAMITLHNVPIGKSDK